MSTGRTRPRLVEEDVLFDSHHYSDVAEGPTEWPDIVRGTFAGDSDWVRRDDVDVEDVCSSDQKLRDACVPYKGTRHVLNQARRGRGFWSVCHTCSSCKRVESARWQSEMEGGSGNGIKGSSKGVEGKAKSDRSHHLRQRLASRTRCRMGGEQGHWQTHCPKAGGDMLPPEAGPKRALSEASCGYVAVQKLGVLKSWLILSASTTLPVEESTKLFGVTVLIL